MASISEKSFNNIRCIITLIIQELREHVGQKPTLRTNLIYIRPHFKNCQKSKIFPLHDEMASISEKSFNNIRCIITLIIQELREHVGQKPTLRTNLISIRPHFKNCQKSKIFPLHNEMASISEKSFNDIRYIITLIIQELLKHVGQKPTLRTNLISIRPHFKNCQKSKIFPLLDEMASISEKSFNDIRYIITLIIQELLKHVGQKPTLRTNLISIRPHFKNCQKSK